MNSKRQTIWLVSMLGLMVVLSAYYLFTDEAEHIPAAEEDTLTGMEAENEILVEGVGMLDPETAMERMGNDSEQSEEDADEPRGGAIAGEGAADTLAESDKEVLERMTTLSGADAITAMQIERDAAFSRRIEELTAAITDESASEEEIAEAVNQHSALMDLESKLIAFEEKLLADYENVAVMYDEEKDHYTVHISAPQLERSEVASIVTEAVHDLSADVHQITVRLHR